MKKLDKFNELVDNLNPDLPLTEEETESLFMLAMVVNPKVHEIVYSDDPELKEMTGLLILVKRLEILSTVKLTIGAALFISQQIVNPGQAVLYAYYIHRKTPINKVIDLEYAVDVLFPNGMISEKQHREIWDAQKLSTPEEQEEAKLLQQYGVHDNLLDYKLTWEK